MDRHIKHQSREQERKCNYSPVPRSTALIADNFIGLPITCREMEHNLCLAPTSPHRPDVNEILLDLIT